MLRCYVAAAFIFVGAATGAQDLQYDRGAVIKEQIFNNLVAQTKDCMYGLAQAQVQQGARDSARIVAFEMQMCSGPLISHMSNALKLPLSDAQGFARAMAYDELNRIPGLVHAAPAPSVRDLTESQFDEQFRCPESIANEEQNKQAFADSILWYGLHHSVVTQNGVMLFRIQLLARHHCNPSLEYLLKATISIPSYDVNLACNGNPSCVKLEKEAFSKLEKSWSSVDVDAKRNCLSLADLQNFARYSSFLDCLARQDKH